MARAIDSEVAYRFLSEQLVKETGAFSKGVNKGLNIARSAMRNPDAIPTLTPPNEPLTLEKLENMEDTTPVWWDQINSWVLVYKGNLTTWSGKHLYAKGSNGKFYRRPPEGEA